MSNPLLKGIRVLDLTRLLPGPFATQYLAQMGAEVIKIEEPEGGDYARTLMPELFAVVNRGKKSVTLDLRKPDDVAAFHQLVATADVVIESFRPGVMARMGCSYETLKAINPALVYVALTGYGQTGPYRDVAGHDINYLAYAGVLDQMGHAGGAPALSNVQIADLAGGALTCAVGLLGALVGAKASGQGSFVDSAMLDGSLALNAVALAGLRSHGHSQPRGRDMLTGALPNYAVYKCRDGRYLAIGALEPKFFFRLLKALHRQLPGHALLARKPDNPPAPKSASSSAPAAIPERLESALSHPRKARRVLAPLRWGLKALFRLRSRDAWVTALAEADACTAPVLTLEEALRNTQVSQRKLLETTADGPAFACPVLFDGQRPAALADAPELGADSALLTGQGAVAH